ncbi:MAG: glycosyltransferase [Flavobacteriales bacterium]|nr:glycosyltransferase [Flavobacteriales bacterium]
MRIGLQTWGTDGDFYPFLALAIGLKQAGHEVSLAYTSINGKDYSTLKATEGIRLIKANGNGKFPSNANPYAITAKPGSFREYSKLLKLFFDPFTDEMYAASKQLCMENELVIGHAVCHTLLTACQKFNCPRISLVLTPLVIRSKYVSPIGIQLGAFINSFLWNIGGMVATKSWFQQAKSIRISEGLPPVKSLQKELFTSELLTIVAASESFLSRPKDWAENIRMTGFLNLPSTHSHWKIPTELREFLDAGEPPVYMTFGSCMQFDVEASTQLLVDAARCSGKRAIIQSDWSKLIKPNDSNIYCIESAPHSEIFPLCSLILHHGGAGTTQAALLAGKPCIVVAHGFDQVYWGDQLKKSGVSGKTLIRRHLKSETIVQEIFRLIKSDAGKKSALIGTKMRMENGVVNAVKAIESSIAEAGI